MTSKNTDAMHATVWPTSDHGQVPDAPELKMPLIPWLASLEEQVATDLIDSGFADRDVLDELVYYWADEDQCWPAARRLVDGCEAFDWGFYVDTSPVDGHDPAALHAAVAEARADRPDTPTWVRPVGERGAALYVTTSHPDGSVTALDIPASTSSVLPKGEWMNADPADGAMMLAKASVAFFDAYEEGDNGVDFVSDIIRQHPYAEGLSDAQVRQGAQWFCDMAWDIAGEEGWTSEGTDAEGSGLMLETTIPGADPYVAKTYSVRRRPHPVRLVANREAAIDALKRLYGVSKSAAASIVDDRNYTHPSLPDDADPTQVAVDAQTAQEDVWAGSVAVMVERLSGGRYVCVADPAPDEEAPHVLDVRRDGNLVLAVDDRDWSRTINGEETGLPEHGAANPVHLARKVIRFLDS